MRHSIERMMTVSVAIALLLLSHVPPAIAHDHERLQTTSDIMGIITDPKTCEHGVSHAGSPGKLEVGETIYCVAAHVETQRGDGADGPAVLSMTGPTGAFSVEVFANAEGVLLHRLAAPVKAGTYKVQVRYRGTQHLINHKHSASTEEKPQPLIQDLLASSALREYEVKPAELKVDVSFAPGDTIKSGYTLVGSEALFRRNDRCLSGCADVSIQVRDKGGKPVESAEVKIGVLAIAQNAIGGDPAATTGMVCDGEGSSLACSDELKDRTDEKGRLKVTYWSPGVITNVQTRITVKAKVKLKNGRTLEGAGSRILHIEPNYAMSPNRIGLTQIEGAYLAPTMLNAVSGEAVWLQAGESLNNTCDWLSFVTAHFNPVPALVIESICSTITYGAVLLAAEQSLMESGLILDSYCLNRGAISPAYELRVLLAGIPLASGFVASDFIDSVHRTMTDWAWLSRSQWREPASDHLFEMSQQLNGELQVSFVETSAMEYVNRFESPKQPYSATQYGDDGQRIYLAPHPAAWMDVWIGQGGSLGQTVYSNEVKSTIINGYQPELFLASNLGCGRGR